MTSRGRGPRTGRPPPEGAKVAYALIVLLLVGVLLVIGKGSAVAPFIYTLF